MKVSHGREDKKSSRGGANFTGGVWQDTLLDDPEAGARVYAVFFEPGSRTFWHAHEGGQVLYVTSEVDNKVFAIDVAGRGDCGGPGGARSRRGCHSRAAGRAALARRRAGFGPASRSGVTRDDAMGRGSLG